MGFVNLLKNACTKLGENNKAIYPMVAIATANAIFRPTFTMLKKGENPQSKRYAALREGITEIVAVPTYWLVGELAGKCGKYIASKAADKEIIKLESRGNVISDAEKALRKSTAAKKGQAGLMLIGVCTSAGLIIPALCSACVTPIMNKIGAKSPTQKPAQQTAKRNISTQMIYRPAFKNISYGTMKVGGL